MVTTTGFQCQDHSSNVQLNNYDIEQKKKERQTDFLVRDLRAAAVNLYPEVGGENRRQKNFLDITEEDYPPGAGPRPPTIPQVESQERPVRSDLGDEFSSKASTSEHSKKKTSERRSSDKKDSEGSRDRERTPRGQRATPGNSSQSGSLPSREEQLRQLTPEQLSMMDESVKRANHVGCSTRA